MGNQIAAQTSKSTYAAQWQDLYTQANQDDNDADGGGPGLEGAQSEGSTGSTAEGLQRRVKRRRINEGEIPVVSLIIFNENVFFVDVVTQSMSIFN
jgi:hypothetical protein